MTFITLVDRWEEMVSSESLAYVRISRLAEEKNNKTTTYDLSTAQKVSSSTRPPRNIYHMRRVLAITAW